MFFVQAFVVVSRYKH